MKHLQAMNSELVLAPIAAATAARAANVDCKGVDYCTFLVAVGAELNTNSTNVVLSLLESDDTVVTNFATFSTNHAVTIDNTSALVHKACVDTRARKRYLRVSLTPDTTTNGPVITSVVAVTDKEIKAADSNESIS